MISLIGTGLAILFWFLKEWSANKHDPAIQRQKQSEAIDREIATGNAADASIRLDRWLSDIRGSEQRQAGNAGDGGQASNAGS